MHCINKTYLKNKSIYGVRTCEDLIAAGQNSVNQHKKIPHC